MTHPIKGAKGSGAQHTPVESPDNLRSIAYFRILDLVSEGEIAGLVNGQQSIYLDETPLANYDGTSNFPKAHVEARTGTPDQTVIPGFDSTENEISVNVELKSASPWLRSITNPALSAIRLTLGVPALSKANTSTGDITGYTINYKIELQTDGGAFQLIQNGNFTGKTTTKYQRSLRIDLPTATTGWQIKVTRLTANANSSAIQDITTIDSYTEIVDSSLAYPDSALIGVMGDASQFTNIPQRAYDLWGRIIQVPSNYDVTDRSYTGTWDGTFKPSWTDNPAWIFYDICTNTRYGLGHLVSAAQVDKWELYKIGQYCDELVDDGHGGTEPRFTCNIYLQTQADAYKLLNDLSTVFRGISYWANGTIVASADMPADPVYTYTDANVIDGKFTYSASARKTRYSSALVSWNDPRNFYRTKIEYVEDAVALARYGFQQATATAVGCTSQGQAQRFGKWLLLTSRLETDTVTFSVGLEGTVAAPGQIIRVADSARAGKRQGGRVHSATITAVTVDNAPTVAVGDSLTVIMPDGVSQTRTVSAVSGKVITVSTAFTSAPLAESVWTVESSELAAQTYRVLAVTEDKSDEKISFTITALQHNASKFEAVDNGTSVVIPPVSALATKPQDPPTNVAVSSNQVIVQGASQTTLSISWDAPADAATYDVDWRRDDGDWTGVTGAQGQTLDVPNVYTGNYKVRVRARNASNNASVWAYASSGGAIAIIGKQAPPGAPTVTATGGQLQIRVDWQWPTGLVADTSYTELWVSLTSTFADGASFGTFAYPINTATITGLLPQQERWIWARLVDKSQLVGEWSVPAHAVGGDVTDLFEPLQSDIDAVQNQADDLRTDVDQAIADLNQEVTDRTTAINDEANARATAILNEQNTRAAAITAEQTIRQSADDSLAVTISQVSAGTGEQFDPAKIWYFDTTVEGWTSGANPPTIVDGWLRPGNATSGNARAVSPGGAGVVGQSYRFVKARIKRIGSPVWDGGLLWNPGSGFTTTPYTIPEPAFDAAGISTVVWDDIPWWPNTIDGIRIDLGYAQTDTDYFLIDWVAIGRPTPGAGVAALQDETAARVTADSAEATQRTALATQMRGTYTGTDVAGVTTGLIYSERQARSTAVGAVAADVSALQARMPAGSGTVATEASVTNEESARVSADSALSTRTSAMEARMPSGTDGLATSASVSDEATARATADSTMASDISLLGAHNAGQTAFNLNSNTVSIDGGSTLAQTLTGLQAADSAVNARVDSEQTARASGDTANANSVLALQASFAATLVIADPDFEATALGWGGNTDGSGTLPAGVARFGPSSGAYRGTSYLNFDSCGTATAYNKTIFKVTAGEVINITAHTQGLTAPVSGSSVRVGLRCYDINGASIGHVYPTYKTSTGATWTWAQGNIGGLVAVPAGAFAAQVVAVVSGLTSGRILFDAVEIDRGTPTTRANASAISATNVTVSAQGSDIEANATQISNLTTTVGGHTASISTLIGTTDGLEAQAVMVMDVDGRISGMKATATATQTDVVFAADKFSIVSPTGSGARTEYSGGNWRVYDSSGTLRVRMGIW